jgi:hypothetical protein
VNKDFIQNHPKHTYTSFTQMMITTVASGLRCYFIATSPSSSGYYSWYAAQHVASLAVAGGGTFTSHLVHRLRFGGLLVYTKEREKHWHGRIRRISLPLLLRRTAVVSKAQGERRTTATAITVIIPMIDTRNLLMILFHF